MTKFFTGIFFILLLVQCTTPDMKVDADEPEKDLFEDVIKNNIKSVRKKLDSGRNVNARLLKNGNTLLLESIRREKPEIVRLLLERNADIHLEGTETALMFSIHHPKSKAYRLLMQRGADISRRNYGALCVAVAQSTDEFASDLMKRLTDAGTILDRHCGGLLGIRTKNRLEMIRTLASKGADISFKYAGGYQLIHSAAAKGDVELLKFLISKGADPNAKEKTDDTDKTPLYYSLNFKYKAAADFLRQNKAEEYRDSEGRTFLHMEASRAAMQTKDVIENIKFYAGAGIDRTLKDRNNKTAYDILSDYLNAEKDAGKKEISKEQTKYIAELTAVLPKLKP
ncbi:MAG TPA: ankyrin repeat domain-containing protein [Leptospiraceae bacterium]|nr:ankyrin repeat domain-containing protein [Leptospiraceae bacterium]